VHAGLHNAWDIEPDMQVARLLELAEQLSV
jgi:hypothetical protein